MAANQPTPPDAAALAEARERGEICALLRSHSEILKEIKAGQIRQDAAISELKVQSAKSGAFAGIMSSVFVTAIVGFFKAGFGK